METGSWIDIDLASATDLTKTGQWNKQEFAAFAFLDLMEQLVFSNRCYGSYKTAQKAGKDIYDVLTYLPQHRGEVGWVRAAGVHQDDLGASILALASSSDLKLTLEGNDKTVPANVEDEDQAGADAQCRDVSAQCQKTATALGKTSGDDGKYWRDFAEKVVRRHC